MTFTYSVYATGHGFATYFTQFKHDKLLTRAQITFIVHCKMKDDPKFWQDGPQMILTKIDIHGE